jgi:hypothetical protein
MHHATVCLDDGRAARDTLSDMDQTLSTPATRVMHRKIQVLGSVELFQWGLGTACFVHFGLDSTG